MAKSKFGEKTYKDIPFHTLKVGRPNQLPSSSMQPDKIESVNYGIQSNPKKQFMKSINYEDKFQSSCQQSYDIIDKKLIE